ncbi:NADH-quinone oxidoreductase subunit M [Vulcanimicrobium alpinum]|uniref:NADH-quinone oxidoreductase subunit M n=1 Tax=Vulcanimicrobium alpinum TaxID=3016050 RepID=A0AAN1XXD0_UNVUL|nr:NADH-quinone oxidoreductase subunit M [Vulcanimicrobium alpinum]BDE07145.1 NADH-quinone oxidoreductase subunit M [Vulcanimicrobium alpinum]
MIAVALVLVPILIGLGLYALPRGAVDAARAAAAVIAGLSVVAVIADPHAADASLHWLARPFDASFHLGYGPVSYWLVLLLAVVTFSAVLTIRGDRGRELAAQLLVLQGAMNGVFLAKDLLLFALFWDLMLLPVFLVLIGSSTHARAAWKYLIYNLVGGLALLLATAAFGVVAGSTDVIGNTAAHPAIGMVWGTWIFAGFAFAFLVKTPVFLFHTWMPDTYAELPPAAVAVVSAVQSKAGLYGFLVITLPLLAPEMAQAKTLMFVLGSIALVYGALAALAQRDAKRVVAYSSLSHLGLILLACFSGSVLAYSGAVVYMVAHGLFSAALFLTLGAVEMREETRDLRRLGGLGARNPRLAGALMLGALAALGLPGLAGFAGEILILTGLFKAGWTVAAVVALLPVVLASAYMLRLFQGIMNGPEVPDLPERRDLTWLEGLALAPLIAAFVWLGINPSAVVALSASGAAATPPAAILSAESVRTHSEASRVAVAR